jgi:hypothetical protein
MASLEVVSWTGYCYKGTGYSTFHKDETALLNPPNEVLFFQTFGLDPDALASYVPPPEPETPERWCSQDYDARWRWTTVLIPSCIGHGRAVPLAWATIERLRTEREGLVRALKERSIGG